MRRLRACSLGELNGSRKTLDLLRPVRCGHREHRCRWRCPVPIATGEETLQPPAKRHCELGLQLASILPIDPRFEDGAP
jgi:hypothetical protein